MKESQLFVGLSRERGHIVQWASLLRGKGVMVVLRWWMKFVQAASGAANDVVWCATKLS